MNHIRIAVLFAFLTGSASHAQQAKGVGEATDGLVLYKAYCAVCHGVDAKGDGPMAKNLRYKPTDLTRLTARNGGTFPLVRVRKVIAGEEELPSGHGTRLMPIWGPIFSTVAWDRDLGLVRVYNLAKYIGGLQK